MHKRMMIFVDGSNFLIEFAKELGVNFRADKPPAEAIEAANWLFRPMSNSWNRILYELYLCAWAARR